MNNYDKYHFYNELARFYDDFYKFKDYKAEVNYIYKIFNTFKNVKATNILDVGCGTGEHLKYFSRYFENVYGLDPNKPMINIAKSKFGSRAKFFIKSIQEFNHKPLFNLITSFSSSLNYVIGFNELTKSMEKIHAALSYNGIAIIQMHDCKDKDYLFSAEARHNKNRLIIVGDWKRKNKYGINLIDFFYHLNSEGKWHVYHDVHKEYFYKKEEIRNAMKIAGFRKIRIRKTTKRNSPFKTSEFICSGTKL